MTCHTEDGSPLSDAVVHFSALYIYVKKIGMKDANEDENFNNILLFRKHTLCA